MTLIASSSSSDSVNEIDSAEKIESDARKAAETLAAQSDAVVSSVFIGQRPVLRNWKMMADGPQTEEQDEQPVSSVAAEENADLSFDIPAVTAPERNFSVRRIATSRPIAPIWLQIAQAGAVFLTVAWVTYAAIYIMALPGSIKAITSSPLTLGGILASVLAPIAMMWLCIATWQRRSDANLYALALKEELRSLLFPTAEEQSALSDDIRQLMRQAADMSASSRAAIKAIQRARSGLRTELRDFVGLTQKTEFHIDRMTESLGKSSGDLLSLTETIEAQSTVIADKAQRGVTAWENVSAEISELNEEVESIFTSGHDKLLAASDEATLKIKSIETSLMEAVESLSAKIGGVADRINVTGKTLDGQAEKLLDVSHSITLGAERLEESLVGAERISGAVENVMDVMTTSLSKVELTAENLFVRTDSIEKKLEERAETLKVSADKLLENTEGLQNVGDIATHKLGEALSMAISGADTITNAVRKSRDMIEKSVQDATAEIVKTTNESDVKFADLLKSSSEHRGQLTLLIAEMESSRAQMEASITGLDNAQAHIVETADKAQNALDTSTQNMVDRTQEPLNLINQSIERLQTQTTELDDKLSVRIAEVSQESGKLKSLVGDVSTSLTGSLQDISQATAHVKIHARQMDEEFAAQRLTLKNMLSEIEQTAENADFIIQARHDSLKAALDVSEERIVTIGDKFEDRGQALLQKINEVSETVTTQEGKMIDALQAIDINALKAEISVKQAVEVLDTLSNQVAPQCGLMVEKAELLHGRYAQLQDNMVVTADMALSCLNEMGHNLDQRFERVGAETMSTSKTIMELTDGLTDALRDIRDVSEDTQERLTQIQTGVKGRTDDLQLITDQVRLKVDVLHNNLDSHIKELGDVVGKAISNLSDASDEFGKSADVLDAKSADAIEKLLLGSQKYKDESQVLNDMGDQALIKTAKIIHAVHNESANLVDATKANLGDLQKTGETLSVRAREVEEYMKGSLVLTQSYGEELRKQAQLIAEQSSNTVDVVSDSTTRLSAKLSEICGGAESAVTYIEDSRQKLSAEGSRLESYTRSAIAAADETGEVFSRHSVNLYKSVAEMADQARKFRESQLRIERESFLSAAKFVIESLYSLAVDVSRHLQDDVDGRIMRAYQKGDVAVYVRHLAEIVPNIPMEKSQRKFIEDSEFRVYVLRFIRQFEELLEQSQANDYADLLSSVFATSDIGKLYKVLCDIAGRDAKDW